jgi:anti-sigma regulatory factor (Ser/Thr protein kinase)
VQRELRVATSALGPGLDAVESALRGEGIPDAAVLDLRLVSEEVLTNLAKYGHDDGGEHWVRVRLSFGSADVTLEFTDDGRPFDPISAHRTFLAAPVPDLPIGGLGIHLMLSLVDAAQYARVGSENVLTLRKRTGVPQSGMP